MGAFDGASNPILAITLYLYNPAWSLSHESLNSDSDNLPSGNELLRFMSIKDWFIHKLERSGQLTVILNNCSEYALPPLCPILSSCHCSNCPTLVPSLTTSCHMLSRPDPFLPPRLVPVMHHQSRPSCFNTENVTLPPRKSTGRVLTFP